MNYKLKIVRTKPNPEYDKEMADWEDKNKRNRNDYGMMRNNDMMDPTMPLKEFTEDVLICELTDEQFKAFKLEALKSFE